MVWAAAVAVFVWWLTTGVALFLCALPPATYRWSLAAATLLLVAALGGIAVVADDASVPAAWCSFTGAILVWGWLELSYYMGLVTGPRAQACPTGVGLAERFRLGVAVSLYHELAVIVAGSGLLVLTWGTPNPVAAETFLVLWVMRWSAKLNLFLGVPNVNVDVLPRHLHYLATYMRRRPLNALFPASVTAGTAVATWILAGTFAPGASDYDRVAGTLVATLLGLAVLEHWFLVLPLNEAVLWAWGRPAATTTDAKAGAKP